MPAGCDRAFNDVTPVAYRGRFAPSPSGTLHFGSLLAALASYADARAHHGTWLVRIEDLDRPREVAGAAEAILGTLHAFGMHWDEPVIHQSSRQAAYAMALEQLDALGLSYPCGCTRSEVARHGRAGRDGPIYPGTCRYGLPSGRAARALRLRLSGLDSRVEFHDLVQGARRQDVAAEVGDFVLRRADGIVAYQLAVVVDDAWQGITQIVRGADLLDSTPRQILLQRVLGLPQPRYAHIPLVLDLQGRKLSKSDAAAPVDPRDPMPALRRAWALLGQMPVPGARTPAQFWRAAPTRWRRECVAATAIHLDGTTAADISRSG